VRGLPIVEISRSPLVLRLLFELYAPAGQMPRLDIDSIGLYEEFWARRIETDESPGHRRSGADLTAEAEAVGFGLLAEGRIQADRLHVQEMIQCLTGASRRAATAAADALRARHVLSSPGHAGRLRFFHQTFMEHTIARATTRRGESAMRLLAHRVLDDPADFFYGEVAAQMLLLAGRHPAVPVPLAEELLSGWLRDDRPIVQMFALRTYARTRSPSPDLRSLATSRLASVDMDAAKGYLHLVPSAYHDTFATVEPSLAVLWDRASDTSSRSKPARANRDLALRMLDTLTRLSDTHRDAVHRFVIDHNCIHWLLKRDPADWRQHDSLYLRLLSALRHADPRWCVEQAMQFWRRFVDDSDVGRNGRGPRPA
jgi:hypothetical protein